MDITGMVATGATMTGGNHIMNGATTAGIRMMNIVVMMTAMTTIVMIIVLARTGNTINLFPRQAAGEMYYCS